MKKGMCLLLVLLCLLSSGCAARAIQQERMLSARNRILKFAAENPGLLISCAKEAEELHRSLGYRKTKIEISDEKTVKVTAGDYRTADDPAEEMTVENAELYETLEALGGFIRVTADGVEFQCDGFGIAPSSQYDGLFYSFSGSYLDIPYYCDSGMTFAPYGDGIFGTIAGDDNTLYIVPLWESFYYFEAAF